MDALGCAFCFCWIFSSFSACYPPWQLKQYCEAIASEVAEDLSKELDKLQFSNTLLICTWKKIEAWQLTLIWNDGCDLLHMYSFHDEI